MHITIRGDRFTWHAPAGDAITSALYIDGRYQAADLDGVLRWLDEARSVLPTSRWVIDVGANIGTSTIEFAAAGYRVLAIEPVPSNVSILRRNLDVNGLADRVNVVEAAVAQRAGAVSMHGTTHGTGRVIEEDPHQSGWRVRAAPLSTLLEEADLRTEEIALVWSDCEGSEADVIESGHALWAAGVPLLAELWAKNEELVETAQDHFTDFVRSPVSFPLRIESIDRLPAALGSARDVLLWRRADS